MGLIRMFILYSSGKGRKRGVGSVAGGLASRRSKLIAVLMPQMNNNMFVDTIQSLSDELARRGISNIPEIDVPLPASLSLGRRGRLCRPKAAI